MAQFSDLGATCSMPACKQQDFLPFVCDLCQKKFCLDHRTSISHHCPHSRPEVNALICPKCHKTVKVRTGDDQDMLLEAHFARQCKPSSETKSCPVKGCDKKLTDSGSVVCPKCKARVCLVHRYEDTHSCPKGDGRPSSPGRAHGMVPEWTCHNCKIKNAGTSYRCQKCSTIRSADSPQSNASSTTSKTRLGKKSGKCIIS